VEVSFAGSLDGEDFGSWASQKTVTSKWICCWSTVFRQDGE